MGESSDARHAELPDPGPEARSLASVVVPFFNGGDWLSNCLMHLLRQSYEPLEIIAVDDGSTELSLAELEVQFPEVRFVALPVNRGFCVAANAGIANARGDYIALLNSDAVPEPDWLAHLVAAMASSREIGACASKILTMDEPPKIESAGDCYRPWRSPRGAGLDGDDLDASGPVFGACAAAALYRRDALAEVGAFDEDLASHYEDVELSFRLRLAGYIVWYVSSAKVRHKGHASSALPTVLRQVLRNDILVYVKDMPATLFWLFLPALLARQAYQLVYYGLRGFAGLVVAAKIDSARQLPNFFGKRASVKELRGVSLGSLLRAFMI
jgi:GT2 family glycosyltransferase